jgi:hypothetical protein
MSLYFIKSNNILKIYVLLKKEFSHYRKVMGIQRKCELIPRFLTRPGKGATLSKSIGLPAV